MSARVREKCAYAAGTVVTSDYLPWARVLSESFLEHNPGASFTVLVLDTPSPDQLRDTDRFQLATPQDVEIEPTPTSRRSCCRSSSTSSGLTGPTRRT